MKKMMLMLLVVAAVVVSAQAFAKDYEVIRFGTDPTYPPFASKNADGSLVGFEIDIGNALCERLQATCKWVEIDFDGMIPSLKARKIDGILATMAVTPAREKVIDFSSEVMTTPNALVFKKGAGLDDSPQAVSGKTIGYLQGSTQEVYAKAVLAKAGAKTVAYPDQDRAYADLLSGRLDAALQDMVQAELGFMQSPQGIDFQAGKPIESELMPGLSAIGILKGNAQLKGLLNDALAQLHADGTYAQLQQQYFGDLNLYSGQ